MTVEAALAAHLASHAGLAALIGNRIYAVQLAANVTLPALTYQRISTTPTQHRSGTEHGRVRMQIDGWAATHGGAMALREQIRDAMAQFTRPANPRVDVALLQDDRDLPDPDSKRWRASMDYYIWTEED